ncbi:hypothetical protein N0V94_002723 [Neodidymelliopsis sp. IMI 364377]|nr:hypothetical protein N0V94_002723 [Neodidymelliopsis sp. IMI 364377]
MSPRDVDEEIRAKVQQVLLHRPISPSEGMAALSRQLTHTGPRKLSLGAPSAHDQGPTLSRKVQSELSLMDLRGTEPLQDSLDVVTPGPLEGTGLPSEETKVSPGPVIEDAIHCDALVALKELGALVARRKGLDVSDFLTKFVALLSAGSTKKIPEELVPEAPTLSCNTEAQEDRADDGVTVVPSQQKLQSELQIGAGPECRRRFSFEPGDDRVQEVEVSLGSYDALSPTDSTDSESSSPKGLGAFIEGLQMEDGDDNDSDDDLDPLVLSSSPDTPKPSLIPCPIYIRPPKISRTIPRVDTVQLR